MLQFKVAKTQYFIKLKVYPDLVEDYKHGSDPKYKEGTLNIIVNET